MSLSVRYVFGREMSKARIDSDHDDKTQEFDGQIFAAVFCPSHGSSIGEKRNKRKIKTEKKRRREAKSKLDLFARSVRLCRPGRPKNRRSCRA